MSLAAVLHSHPRFCVACGAAQEVRVHPVGAPELATEMPCPHCGPPYIPLVIDIQPHTEECP